MYIFYFSYAQTHRNCINTLYQLIGRHSGRQERNRMINKKNENKVVQAKLHWRTLADNGFNFEQTAVCPKLNCPKFFLWLFYKEFVWQAKEIVRK